MKVYSPKDRFKIDLKELGIDFVLAPLTAKQKGEILACMANKGGSQLQDRWDMVRLALRYSVKAANGFEDSDGKPLELALDGQGNLTDEAIDLLMNIGQGQDVLIAAALQFSVGGVPDALRDSETGKPLEGVELTYSGKA